ncbi:MAG TPA: AgmX/PglI C-terminal domain-containing protein [candidate division Zixibacteria bacterium]|nr:AgmX/PglI C-terminal domain-containing protein [candidate division Zixibacteria bacterium]
MAGQPWFSSKRVTIAVAAGLFGLALIALAFRIGVAPQEPGPPAAGSEREAPPKRQRPTWNVALGNVVYLARELGLDVRAVKGDPPDIEKIAARIESQLMRLREIYREEGEKNPILMGSLVLQLRVGADGAVGAVEEIASRLSDTRFKRAAIAEVSGWNFAEIVTEPAVIRCPLMFVREGMEIVTLVSWERALARPAGEQAAAAPAGSAPANQAALRKAAPQPVLPAPAQPQPRAVPAAGERSRPEALYQIKYATPLRKEPNFSSESLTRLTIGTKVTLLRRTGDWVEVRYNDGGLTGYLRKEFVVPVDANP